MFLSLQFTAHAPSSTDGDGEGEEDEATTVASSKGGNTSGDSFKQSADTPALKRVRRYKPPTPRKGSVASVTSDSDRDTAIMDRIDKVRHVTTGLYYCPTFMK